MENERVKISAFCVKCLVDKQFKIADKMESEHEKVAYMRQVLQVIYENMDKLSTPIMEACFAKNYKIKEEEKQQYQCIKRKYNELFLSKESAIYDAIMNSDEPVKTAIQYVQMGNYIDFGVNGTFSEEILEQLMDTVSQNQVGEKTYLRFLKQCSNGNRVVYLLDNCGEAVLDKIFIRVLKKTYSNLEIIAVVRGEDVVNDVTKDDAEYIGLPSICKVIGNGTAIAGTSMDHVEKVVRDAIEGADLIISKGQGNFETMYGNGFPVYYIFLCKCEWFMKRFLCERNTAIFHTEDEICKILQKSGEKQGFVKGESVC